MKMKNKLSIIFLLIFITSLIISWRYFILKQTPNKLITNTAPLTKIILAVDWTPNTNHTGIYVAQNKGWYQDEGLELQILPPTTVSPTLLINSGQADVGIGATEGIIADVANGADVVSIAAILAHNTSALVALASSTIQNPRDLTDKIYGGWGANYETPIVNTMIKNDGGTPRFKTVILDGDPTPALQSRRIDFAWVFAGWEVLAAKQDGVNLQVFYLNKYGIPDYYTPNFITNQKVIKNKPEVLRKFLRATTKGYEYARTHARESAEILINSVPPETFPNKQLVYDSQDYISVWYADPGENWGWQNSNMWHDYPQFMLDAKSILNTNGQPVEKINFETLYTNEFLP